MAAKKRGKLYRLIVPGLVYQSILIAGGYGTGAELSEFFFPYGSLGGLIAMSTITLLELSIVCAATWEFARVFKTYDYRSFIKQLLGPAWIVFEVCYLILLLLVLSVVVAASGANFNEVFGLSKWVGIVLMAAGTIFLIFKGTEAVKTFMASWSYVLYAVYLIFMAAVFVRFGGQIAEQLTVVKEIKPGMLFGSSAYSFYNCVCITFILFVVPDFESRSEAITSGLLAGLIGIVPGIMLFITMTSQYPSILEAQVPINAIFGKLNMRWLHIIFQIVLFGTFIETGTGFIKAATDRLEVQFCKPDNPRKWIRPVTVCIAVMAAVLIAQFGLIPLVAKGYGTITWIFFIIYIIPLLTWGMYKIYRHDKAAKLSAA